MFPCARIWITLRNKEWSSLTDRLFMPTNSGIVHVGMQTVSRSRLPELSQFERLMEQLNAVTKWRIPGLTTEFPKRP